MRAYRAGDIVLSLEFFGDNLKAVDVEHPQQVVEDLIVVADDVRLLFALPGGFRADFAELDQSLERGDIAVAAQLEIFAVAVFDLLTRRRDDAAHDHTRIPALMLLDGESLADAVAFEIGVAILDQFFALEDLVGIDNRVAGGVSGEEAFGLVGKRTVAARIVKAEQIELRADVHARGDIGVALRLHERAVPIG